MELNKDHRLVLLNALGKALKDVDLQESCLRSEKDNPLKHWFEVERFLALQRIELIKKSISENDIDY